LDAALERHRRKAAVDEEALVSRTGFEPVLPP
jgi:hypothetical protein